MTKEELIKLKAQTALAIKFNAVLNNCDKSYNSGYLTYKAIEEKDTTNEAIASIDNNLSSLVINAAKYGIDIKHILVDIDWDFFKTKDFVEGSLIPRSDDVNFASFTNMRIFNYLLIQMQYKVESYDTEDEEIIEDKLNRISPYFIIKYDYFLQSLIERGYLDKGESFDNFLASNARALNFQIDFERQKKRTRIKNN